MHLNSCDVIMCDCVPMTVTVREKLRWFVCISVSVLLCHHHPFLGLETLLPVYLKWIVQSTGVLLRCTHSTKLFAF